jgi:hypothetical protein
VHSFFTTFNFSSAFKVLSDNKFFAFQRRAEAEEPFEFELQPITLDVTEQELIQITEQMQNERALNVSF